MRFTILANWSTPSGLVEEWNKQSQDGRGKWNKLQLVTPNEDPELYVIINAVPYCHPRDCAHLRLMYFSMEPYLPLELKDWTEAARWFGPRRCYFHADCPNLGQWHLGYTYSELARKTFTLKHDRISAITSTKYVDPGHKLRIHFIHALNEATNQLYCYGTYQSPQLKHYLGALPHNQKEKGLEHYKYHLAVENNAIDNYFTEKIIDGILMNCLVFYWGCPNLETLLPPRAFIRLSLANFDEDAALIQRAIKEDWWSQRRADIQQAREIILNQHQLFPRIESLVAAAPEEGTLG